MRVEDRGRVEVDKKRPTLADKLCFIAIILAGLGIALSQVAPLFTIF